MLQIVFRLIKTKRVEEVFLYLNSDLILGEIESLYLKLFTFVIL